MELCILDPTFTVCKLPLDSPVGVSEGFFFVGRTDEELSLVCETQFVPKNALVRDDGWRGFRVQGTLDFSLIGILAEISGLLAREGISIFAVSTYNTDYVLTKTETFEKAIAALSRVGYGIR